MIYLLYIFIAFFPSNSIEDKEILSETYNKVTIQLKDENNILKEVYSSEKESDIKMCQGFLNGRTAPNFKCGYSGKIIFHGKTENLEADFNITSCNHIVFMKGNHLISNHLSNKAQEFLHALAKQK